MSRNGKDPEGTPYKGIARGRVPGVCATLLPPIIHVASYKKKLWLKSSEAGISYLCYMELNWCIQIFCNLSLPPCSLLNRKNYHFCKTQHVLYANMTICLVPWVWHSVTPRLKNPSMSLPYTAMKASNQCSYLKLFRIIQNCCTCIWMYKLNKQRYSTAQM